MTAREVVYDLITADTRQPYYQGRHRLDPMIRRFLDARDSSGLTGLLTDRAMLGPAGRHSMPEQAQR